ncbi:sensor histidine kinase [Fibrella forsythiae]|uniref:histidine kinase n=1 Tax=Fibrella forsythiae TaxID=2817061 RepID=A0ABS3JPY4_9BACT|nr:ATP-binding protein [Fibrella forsythiae]MBO0950987.1 sensor histidine kinase [Fibrella forsythiae]
MNEQLSDVLLIIGTGTMLVFGLAAFAITLIVVYRRRYAAHQTELTQLHEAHQREILQAQLETQNQTLQQVAEGLHDHVGQMLSVVWLHLNCLHADTQATPYQASVTELLTHTATLVADVRNLSKSLSTDTITRFGLRACLNLELDRINRAAGTQQAVMQVTGDAYSMGQQTETILLRMVQEALNNALKHAPGSPISLLLVYQPDELAISVVDEGPGFSMDSLQVRSLTMSGQGIDNLRRRASLLGGTCTWQAGEAHRGTKVILIIPRLNPIEDNQAKPGSKTYPSATI